MRTTSTEAGFGGAAGECVGGRDEQDVAPPLQLALLQRFWQEARETSQLGSSQKRVEDTMNDWVSQVFDHK